MGIQPTLYIQVLGYLKALRYVDADSKKYQLIPLWKVQVRLPI